MTLPTDGRVAPAGLAVVIECDIQEAYVLSSSMSVRERSAYEYRFGRISGSPQFHHRTTWIDYLLRGNVRGQTEWWYHRDGCGKWFLVERDTDQHCAQSRLAGGLSA
jgi:sarcosine oxidase subunit delta